MVETLWPSMLRALHLAEAALTLRFSSELEDVMMTGSTARDDWRFQGWGRGTAEPGAGGL